MGKTKEYFYEQECRDICDAIQDLDFGDEDFQPTMAEMVNQVMDKQKKKLAFHNYDDIENWIKEYIADKGGE
jgi:non-homologous end joining protein Ku|tara:strand:+ start:507 stop:722 length:216 start_codon:yes stop_codon:yes gene_type:complete